MAYLALLFGLESLTYGGLILIGVVKTNEPKPDSSEKLSPHNRYFLRRYWAGIMGVISARNQ
jgi:hypothetical protein